MIHVFIVNGRAGYGNFAAELRNSIKSISGIEYYIMHTRAGQSEADLVKITQELFEGEEIRFYACGGQGTLCRMLNGFENFDDVEVAFYPMGLTNDYMKVFGKDAEKFLDIKNLVGGRAVRVDYIRTNHGVCLNTFSVGFDAATVQKVNEYIALSNIHPLLPYSIGILSAVWKVKPVTYEGTVDGRKFAQKMCELFIGNGGTMGGNLYFKMNPDVRDGIGDIVFGPDKKGFGIFPIVRDLQKKSDILITERVTRLTGSKIKVHRTDGQPMAVNMDGDIYEGYSDWEVEIVKEGLPLVVPWGVNF